MSAKDFSSRVISEFEEELARRGILDDPLPPTVVAALKVLEDNLTHSIITAEGDTVETMSWWISATRVVLETLEVELESHAPDQIYSQAVYRDLSATKDGEVERLKSTSIRCKKPEVFAEHCAELAHSIPGSK